VDFGDTVVLPSLEVLFWKIPAEKLYQVPTWHRRTSGPLNGETLFEIFPQHRASFSEIIKNGRSIEDF